MTVLKSYPNGECPDCNNDIPKDVVPGQECENCGHVFVSQAPCDDAHDVKPFPCLIHSTGPWSYNDDRLIESADGDIICDPHYAGGVTDPPEIEANANLMAAAPDLLSSLINMVDMFERHIAGKPGPDDAAERWDAARNAIAKAKGGK